MLDGSSFRNASRLHVGSDAEPINDDQHRPLINHAYSFSRDFSKGRPEATVSITLGSINPEYLGIPLIPLPFDRILSVQWDLQDNVKAVANVYN